MTTSGATKMTLRRVEKKIACFEKPKERKVDWPANCNAMMKKAA